MSAINDQLFNAGLSANQSGLTEIEAIMLEADIFVRICDQLRAMIKAEIEGYFRILKIDSEKEAAMIDTGFIRCIVNDILATDDYTLTGIAYYTNTHEDVILEVVSGRNQSPSFTLSQKIIHLHRTIRPGLYSNIMKKIQGGSGG